MTACRWTPTSTGGHLTLPGWPAVNTRPQPGTDRCRVSCRSPRPWNRHPRRRHRGDGRVHPPHSSCRRPRDHPPAAKKRLTLIRMTPDLIYDQLIGMGCADEAGVFLGRQSGRRLAAPACATRSRTAGRNRSKSRSIPTPRWRTPMRPAPPGCPARFSAAISAATCRRSIRTSSASPVRSPARSSPPFRRIRPDVGGDPCAEGRPRRQRDARRHRRRAEGSGAGLPSARS